MQGQQAAAGHGLDAVHHQVQEDLLDLPRITFDGRDHLVAAHFHLHAELLELETQEQYGVLRRLAEVDDAERARLGLAHAEHTGDDALHVGDLLTHDAEVLDLGVIRRHPLRKRI